MISLICSMISTRLRPLALPDVAAVDHARAARLHDVAGLAEQLVVVDLRAAREHDQRAPGRLDHLAHGLLLGDLELVVGRGRELVLLGVELRQVELDHVGAHLHRHPGGVVDRVEGVLAALLVERRAARVGPDHERHPVAVAVLAHALELVQVLVLARRADVERVADRVGAEPDRVLDRGVGGRERVVGGRHVGLAVDLEQQRHLAGVVGVVLLGEADLAGDRRVAGLGREPELVLGVLRGRVGEEVARAVLDPLVDRQQQQRPVAGPELEQQPAQAGALAGAEGGEEGLLLGRAADFHRLALGPLRLVDSRLSIGWPPSARPQLHRARRSRSGSRRS